jgi:2'-phosphotransferase
MKRNHIHLAQGVAGDSVISGIFPIHPPKDLSYTLVTGMRRSSQILIYVDVQKALDAGISFELSSNGVVLTAGDSRGFLSPQFFKRVEDSKRVPLQGWEDAPDVMKQAEESGIPEKTTLVIETPVETEKDGIVVEKLGNLELK